MIKKGLSLLLIATLLFCVGVVPLRSSRAEGNGSISGVAWVDSPQDDIRQPSDKMRANVVFRLYSPSDTQRLNPLQTSTTDASGVYSFWGLDAGNYIVRIITPSTQLLVNPDAGPDDTIDSDFSQYTKEVLVSVAEDAMVTNVDAGLYTAEISLFTVRIGGIIWLDQNHDGIRDAGESLMPDIQLSVFDDHNNQTELVSSNASGYWESSAISMGILDYDDVKYNVTIMVPSGYSLSPMNVGSNEGYDSDFDPATGTFSISVFEPGNFTIDAGLYQLNASTPTPTPAPNDPATPTPNVTPTPRPSEDVVPQTGDHNDPMVLLTILGLCTASVIGLGYLWLRRNQTT